MDYNEIIASISSVGFPIVMCLILMYSHQKESEDLRKVIEANTNSITKLYEKLETLTDVIRKGE